MPRDWGGADAPCGCATRYRKYLRGEDQNDFQMIHEPEDRRVHRGHRKGLSIKRDLKMHAKGFLAQRAKSRGNRGRASRCLISEEIF